MQIKPILDMDGNETGAFKYEGAIANKALKLIGRHTGFDKGKGAQTAQEPGPAPSQSIPNTRQRAQSGGTEEYLRGQGMKLYRWRATPTLERATGPQESQKAKQELA